MAKWSKLKGKIPDAPAGDMTSAANPSFLQNVDEAKTEHARKSLPELMLALTEANELWDELKETEKGLNVQFEALGQLLKAHFEDQGVTSVKDTSGQNFYLNIEPYISVKDREGAEQWVSADPDLDYLWGIKHQSLAS